METALGGILERVGSEVRNQIPDLACITNDLLGACREIEVGHESTAARGVTVELRSLLDRLLQIRRLDVSLPLSRRMRSRTSWMVNSRLACDWRPFIAKSK